MNLFFFAGGGGGGGGGAGGGIPSKPGNPLTSIGLRSFACFLSSFHKSIFFEKFFQKYHWSVKKFGSRSGLTCLPGLIWQATLVGIVNVHF